MTAMNMTCTLVMRNEMGELKTKVGLIAVALVLYAFYIYILYITHLPTNSLPRW